MLGKITIPLQLQGGEYTCEFHVMQNLAYDAILGRDFLQKHGTLIDLVDSTLSFKGTAYVGSSIYSRGSGTPLLIAKNKRQKIIEKQKAKFNVNFYSKIIVYLFSLID